MTDNGHDLTAELAAVDFSLLDIMTYLDTHPNDEEALDAKRRYAEASAELRRRYEKTYGALTAAAAGGENCWNWIKDPWPWECR